MQYCKRFIKNRIDAYNNKQEFNISISNIKIMDSILFCKEVWNVVKELTHIM
jgi:hypothetical protein